MKIVHFETIGCKLNQIETESIAQSFAENGFTVDMQAVPARVEGMAACAEQKDSPFLCIINTCTVTGKAEQKARRLIHLLLNIYPETTVLVTGCYAQLEAEFLSGIDVRVVAVQGRKKDLLMQLPQYLLNCFFNTDSNCFLYEKIPFMLQDFCMQKTEEDIQYAKTSFALKTDSFFSHSRSSLKIQDGCNNACSYCRIRLARGKSISLDAGEVVSRVKNLEEHGWSEVILTGVNLSQYSALYEGRLIELPELLTVLLENTQHISFRISSLYPERVDDELCAVLAHERIRPHFHLSVQSGSDEVLSAMCRPYKAQAVYDAVYRLREVKKNPFIACDIIAGFPGETDEDFSRTFEMCSSLSFAWIHAFPFSARPGTKAYTMKNPVEQRIAGLRVRRLTALAVENKKKYAHSWIGTSVRAVMENAQSKTCGADVSCDEYTAITENYLHIRLNKAQGVPYSLQKGYEFTVVLQEDMFLL